MPSVGKAEAACSRECASLHKKQTARIGAYPYVAPNRGSSEQDLVKAVKRAQMDADPESHYSEAEKTIDKVLNAPSLDEKYEGTLVVYRNKGLIPAVAQIFGIKREGYCRILLELVRDSGHPFNTALYRRLPSLKRKME